MDAEEKVEESATTKAEEETQDLVDQVEDDASVQDEAAAEEEYELVELEIDEDDIVRYLEDDEGNRIGFVLLEDGEEAEYLYVEDEDEAGDDGDEFDFGITKEGVAAATNDMNAIYKDGIAVAAEFKGAFDDIKSALDFSSFLKK